MSSEFIKEEKTDTHNFNKQSVIRHNRDSQDVLWMLWGDDAPICLGLSDKVS